MKRTLGKQGPTVSAIALGAMGMSDLYGAADRTESIATIHAALDAGITLIDTGDFYGSGHNELLIREALAGRRRENIVISVKFGAQRDPAGGWVGIDNSPAALKNSLAQSLQRLGTDYIDIYRPARLDPKVPIEDTVGAMAEMVKAGYVRHVGLSEVSAQTVRRAQAVHPICDLQIEYSLISRGIEKEILPTLRELGVGITAYGVLSRGLISGHWSRAHAGEKDFRSTSPRFQGENLARNLQLVRSCAPWRTRGARPSLSSRSRGCWRRAPTSCRSSAHARARGWPNRSRRSRSGSATPISRRSSARSRPTPRRVIATRPTR